VRSIVVHCHFYQPPREDPWLGLIEREPSAAPDHDWNARIARQCYGPLAGIGGSAATGTGNVFGSLSFNVGPTLFEWMEREAPDVYAAILAADRRSARLFGGHGNAMAMPYNHVILPLASRRDKVTEVRWGIADFTRRFGRAPEGMWLPETAVDEETLDVLAVEGIRFTVLAPHQIENAPSDGLPVSFTGSGGRSIAVFTYDGAVAADVAFGQLLADPTGEALAARLAPRRASGEPGEDSVTAIATDGETYGHHHRAGAEALAGALSRLRVQPDVKLENFASILARTRTRREGRIRWQTSWSCPHGIERWRSGCACRVGPATPGGQRWRAPLRDALDALAIRLDETFAREGAALFDDPWAARDGYGAVVALDGDALRDYALSRLRRPPADGIESVELVRARELLELERSVLRMFTSCAWFFDQVTGIETRLVLRIAAHAMGLAGVEAYRTEFLSRLRGADDSGAAAIALVPHGDESYADAVRRAVAGFAAVRGIVPQLGASRIGWFDVARTDAGNVVAAANRRTGRTDHAVAVTRQSAGQPTVTVRLVGAAADEGSALSAAHLPEREAAFLQLGREIGVPVVSAHRRGAGERATADERSGS
jgi:alpha-amylase/alpha-mannosidase (GH57 family)